MLMRGKNCRFTALLILICLSACAAGVFASPLSGKIIVLDPGHGAKNSKGQIVNSGCRSKSGVRELDKTVVIAGILGGELGQRGTTVYFTRDAANFWRRAESQDEDNRGRAEFANSKHADLFLRIHCNWSPHKKQRGVLVLWYKDGSKKIADAVFEAIKKTGVRTEGVRRQYLVGFRFAEVPAILIEYGYLSSREDEKLLNNDEYIKKISDGAASGLEKYFSETGAAAEKRGE